MPVLSEKSEKTKVVADTFGAAWQIEMNKFT